MYYLSLEFFDFLHFSLVPVFPRSCQTCRCPSSSGPRGALVRKGLFFKRETCGCRSRINELLASCSIVSLISPLFGSCHTLADADGSAYPAALLPACASSSVNGSTQTYSRTSTELATGCEVLPFVCPCLETPWPASRSAHLSCQGPYWGAFPNFTPWLLGAMEVVVTFARVLLVLPLCYQAILLDHVISFLRKMPSSLVLTKSPH